MSKKNKPNSTIAKPPAAQIDAIRRLIADGNPELAWSRLQALRKTFPDFKPLFALSFSAAYDADMEQEALLCAYDWVAASPNSQDALEALTHMALKLNFGAIGGDAAVRVEALKGKIIDLPASMQTPFGEMSRAEMVMADTARILLMSQRYHALVALLKDASFPALINNLGLGYFALGKIVLAAETFSTNWASLPSNLFAAERQIRTQLWLHGSDALKTSLSILLEHTPQRAEDALGKINSLILLDEWQHADICWTASSQASYWDGEIDSLLTDLFSYIGISISLRLGNHQQTRQRLESALESTSDYPPLRELAFFISMQVSQSSSDAALQDAPSCVVGELLAWFPATWVDRLSHLRQLTSQHSPAQIEAQMNVILLSCDAHHDYLARAMELGDRDVRNLAIEILKLRAKQNDANAVSTLISLLTRPWGQDEDRFNLLRVLHEREILDPATNTPVLCKGSITEVHSRLLEISGEPTAEMPYPKEGQMLYEEMHALLTASQLEKALAIAQTIYQRYPDIAMSAANLAMIKEGLQHPMEEIETLFQHAFAINHNYRFARAGLARLLAKRGDPDAAEALLQPAFTGGNFHISEWRTLLLAQIEIAKARSDLADVTKLTKSLLELEDNYTSE